VKKAQTVVPAPYPTPPPIPKNTGPRSHSYYKWDYVGDKCKYSRRLRDRRCAQTRGTGGGKCGAGQTNLFTIGVGPLTRCFQGIPSEVGSIEDHKEHPKGGSKPHTSSLKCPYKITPVPALGKRKQNEHRRIIGWGEQQPHQRNMGGSDQRGKGEHPSVGRTKARYKTEDGEDPPGEWQRPWTPWEVKTTEGCGKQTLNKRSFPDHRKPYDSCSRSRSGTSNPQ